MTKNVSFKLKLFLTSFILTLSITFFVVSSFSPIITKLQVDKLRESSYHKVTLIDYEIVDVFNTINIKINSIYHSKEFEDYTDKKFNADDLKKILSSFVLKDKQLLEIGYYNHYTGQIILSSSNNKNNLQKKDFLKVEQTNFDELYYSKIDADLNILVGLHIDDGVLLFKFSLHNLNKIINASKDFNIILLDIDGNYIHFDDKHYNLKTQYPKLYNRIIDNNLFISDNLMSQHILLPNGDKMIALVEYPINIEQTVREQFSPIYFKIFISTVLLSLVLAYMFSIPIRQTNEELESEVRRRTKQLSDSLNLIDKYIIRSKTDLNGIIIEASEAFCNISGYTKEELIGQPHSIVKDPNIDPEVYKNMWETITSGLTWKGKLRNRAKDGSKYWVKAYISPNYDEDGKKVSYTAIRTDITDKQKLKKLNHKLLDKIKVETQKNIEQMQRHHQEQLKNVKLASIGSLTAGITHEINTPLTYIKGNFEMMKLDIDQLPESHLKQNMLEDYSTINDGINRIAIIVDSMRELSQKTSDIKEEVNIYNTLITALTVGYNRSKQISQIFINDTLFNLDIKKDKFKFIVNAQKQKLEQVWIIIINNALDELSQIESFADRNLNIHIQEDGDYINIKFKDNAGGIPVEILDKIFEPFVSTKVHGGMGIGLNIAKQIMDNCRGEILAYNVDGGAVFEVKIRKVG